MYKKQQITIDVTTENRNCVDHIWEEGVYGLFQSREWWLDKVEEVEIPTIPLWDKGEWKVYEEIHQRQEEVESNYNKTCFGAEY